MAPSGGESPRRNPGDEPIHPEEATREGFGERDEREPSRRGIDNLGERTMADLREVINLLDTAWGRRGSKPPPSPAPPIRTLGPYSDLVEIGRGGMGVVYRARDPNSGEFVAIKVPASDWVDDPSLRPRFLRETRIVGALDHPGILPYLDSGEVDGRCYIVAEYCDGPDLAAWLRRRTAPVPPKAAAKLVAALAAAVAHAHDRGILHRDLKPSNVLLPGARDSTDPMTLRPRLTDFGLAKLADPPEARDEAAAAPALTRTGILLGSPPYMAPEQAAGDSASVGPWTDVYGLGAILYEVLTGRPPFRGESPSETLRLAREADPIPVHVLRAGVPRALETIALKCLEKAPARRYASAIELADDLNRFLKGDSILARPPTQRERLRRWARRRPALAGSIAAGLAGVALIVGGVVAWNLSLQGANKEITRQRERADQNVYDSNLQLAAKALEAGQLGRAELILRDMVPPAGSVDRRDFAWGHLWRLARAEAKLINAGTAEISGLCLSPDGRRLAATDVEGGMRLIDLDGERAIWIHQREEPGRIGRPAFSSDGRVLAVAVERAGDNPARATSLVELRSAETGEPLGLGAPRAPGWVEQIGFLDHDALLGVATSSRSPTGESALRFSTWEIGRGPAPAPRLRSVSADFDWLSVAPDGTFYAAPGADGRPVLYDALTNAPRLPLAEAPDQLRGHVFFAPDGDRLAMVRGDDLFVWETASGRLQRRVRGPAGPIDHVALQPRGEAILARAASQEVRLIDPSRNLDKQIYGPAAGAPGVETTRLSFTPDGSGFLANRTVYMEPDRLELRSANDGEPLAESPGRQLGFMGPWLFQGGPDGGAALIYAIRRYLWLWSWPAKNDSPAVDRVAAHAAEIWEVENSPDGSIWATAGDDTNEDRTIKLWDARSGRLIRGWKGHEATVTDLTFSPDGRRLASSSLAKTNSIRVWECPSGRELVALGLSGDESARAIRFDPAGSLLAAGGSNGTLRVWDAQGFSTLWEFRASTDRIHDLTFDPPGDRVASASELGFVRVHDAQTGALLFQFRSPGTVLTVAYDPLGRFLAAGDREGSIFLFDATTNRLIRTIRSDDRQLFGLAFSPDGKTLAVGGHGRTVRLYDPETGNELLSLEGHQAQVNSLAFSSDGQTLASADHEGVVFFWRADRGPAAGKLD